MSVTNIRARTKAVSVPAPVGGWNARDSYADMALDDAVVMQNYWPKTTSVALRFGYTQFATGMTGQSETVMAYAGGSSNKLFSANTGATASIFNVTAGGAIGAADVTGLTNARFQYVNVSTSGGNFMLCVNGADKLRGYNGTSWWTDGDGAHDITGVDTSTCISTNLFKNRVWLIKKNTLTAWYLPVESIAGAANSLDLSAFCPHGGSLVAMGTWTIDSGYGVDDYAVFITNKGDVVVYRGTDPSSASTWAMIGVWWLGSPVGIRPFIKWKGDLLLICQDGLLPLSAALQSSRLNPRVALTNKIQSAISDAVTNYGSNFGWQVLPFPKQNMLVLNVPVQTGNNQEQYVMNTITGAWADFQGWNANCFELYNDNLYFGGNTFVGQAWNTNADAGSAINGFVLQSFNEYGDRGERKRATSMRPLMLTNGNPVIYGGVNWDYNLSNPTSPLTTAATVFGLWDSGVWDAAIWGGGLNPTNLLQATTGSGYAGAPVFKSATLGLQVELVSTLLSLEVGGPL